MRSRFRRPPDVRARRPRTEPSRRRRSALPEDDLRTQLAERLLAVLGIGAVDDQDAVEVVELVLHDACSEALELDPDLVAVRVCSLERDLRRPLDRHPDALERQAALLVG